MKDTLEELVYKTLAALNSFDQQLQSINPLNVITNKAPQFTLQKVWASFKSTRMFVYVCICLCVRVFRDSRVEMCVKLLQREREVCVCVCVCVCVFACVFFSVDRQLSQ